MLVLLHNKKVREHHIFFRLLSSKFKFTKDVPIIVNDETAINNAIRDNTNFYLVGCWRHLGKSVERWVGSAGGEGS